MVYQPASWFSTSDTVPRGEAHFSSCEFSPLLVAPPAPPVATVSAPLPLPIFRLVVSQPASSMAAPAAARTASFFFDIASTPGYAFCDEGQTKKAAGWCHEAGAMPTGHR